MEWRRDTPHTMETTNKVLFSVVFELPFSNAFISDRLWQVQVKVISLEEMRSSLQWLRDTMKTCYGPFGRPALFQPIPGGHVTVTCSSGRILQLLKVDNPLLRTLTLSVQSHTQQYSDCGSFATLLSSKYALYIVDHSLEVGRGGEAVLGVGPSSNFCLILSGMELGVSRHKVAMVTGHVLFTVADYLRSEQCLCKRHLDLSSAGQMMAVVKTTLSSKMPVCSLSSLELNHLSSLLLQGFLQVIPPSTETRPFSVRERLHLHSIMGHSATRSKLISGLLLESTQSCYDGSPDLLHLDAEEEKKEFVSVCGRRDKEGNIVTALFSVSMAGDLPEEYPREVTITSSDLALGNKRALESVAVEQMLSMAERLVKESGVGFVGCQKCIHPAVKVYLENEGVVVVDRISSFLIESVREVTRGQLMSSLSLQYPPHWLGKLRDIRRVSIEKKRYLLLDGFTSHSSLMICCKSETVAEELKPLCSTAISVLEHSLNHPFVLYGGGCTEAILSHFLRQKVDNIDSRVLQELQCNEWTYSCAVRNIASSFAAMASSVEHYSGLVLTDTAFHHCWSFPPYEFCEPFQQPSHSPSHQKQERQNFSNSGTISTSGIDNAGMFSTQNTEVFSSENTRVISVSTSKPDSVGVTSPSSAAVSSSKGIFANKTCCCGAVKLGELPSGCQWRSLSEKEPEVIPEAIHGLLGGKSDCSALGSEGNVVVRTTGVDNSRNTMNGPGEGDWMKAPGIPDVCDPFLAKLKAVELVRDLTSSLLRVAYVVTERTAT